MTLSVPGVPVRDRVLLHLMEFRRLADAVEVPNGMTQAGIALALDVNRSQVTRALAELRAKDLIDEHVTYVRGAARRCRTYALTYPGETYADRLKAMLLKTPAEFRCSTGAVRMVEIGAVFAMFDGKVPFTRFFIALLEDRVLLDYGHPDADARPMPVLLGVENAAPVVQPPAGGSPDEPVPPGENTAQPALEVLDMEDGTGEGPPEGGRSVATVPGTEAVDVQDYRATYDSVLGSAYYDPERAPPPPGIDPQDERLYQGRKPRSGMGSPLLGMILFMVSLLALLMVVAAISSGSFSSGACLCIMWLIMGLVISAFLLMSWSTKVERTGLLRLPQKERLIITGLLVVMTDLTMLILSVMPVWGVDRPAGPSDILANLLVGLPLYSIVLIRSGIPDQNSP